MPNWQTDSQYCEYGTMETKNVNIFFSLSKTGVKNWLGLRSVQIHYQDRRTLTEPRGLQSSFLTICSYQINKT